MREYDDRYSEKLFHQSSSHSNSSDSNYGEGYYVDFNPNFSSNLCKVENAQFQEERDTDYNILGSKGKSNTVKELSDCNIRQIKQIETNPKVTNTYLNVKRGNSKQTMQLNINFKTIFCKLIRDLIDIKLLKIQEKQIFLQYKTQSPSFKSLAKFLNSPQNMQSKQKLTQLMTSPLILRKIHTSDLRIDNKIVMIKFLQIMRKTVYKRNQSQKWKRKT